MPRCSWGVPCINMCRTSQARLPHWKRWGAALQPEGKLIEMLAAVPRDVVSGLDMTGIDVVVRNTFRQKPLYRSYCEHCFRILMDKAREKPQGAERVDLVKQALDIRPVGEAFIATAKMALFSVQRLRASRKEVRSRGFGQEGAGPPPTLGSGLPACFGQQDAQRQGDIRRLVLR